MAPRLRSAVVRFDALPEEALRAIMLALPVDARAQAACVCRGWRAFLADVSLWQVLDLMRKFSFSRKLERLGREFLLQLLVSSGAVLQEVNTDARLSVEEVSALCAAAPRLQVLKAGVIGSCLALLPLLRNDAPYGSLRVCKLGVMKTEPADEDDADDVLLALAAAVATHQGLEDVFFYDVHFTRGLNALVDAAAERRVSRLWIGMSCALDSEFVPALARLLQRGSLISLVVDCADFPLEQEESLAVLCGAMRSCRTLTDMSLRLTSLFGASHRVITELLDAVAALPALSVLDLCWSHVQDATAFGHALGALLAANLPCLRKLNVGYCQLSDVGMASVLDGLAMNTHLRELDCREDNDLSDEFKRDRLEPALAALAARAELDDE